MSVSTRSAKELARKKMGADSYSSSACREVRRLLIFVNIVPDPSTSAAVLAIWDFCDSRWDVGGADAGSSEVSVRQEAVGDWRVMGERDWYLWVME